ncbi:MAG: sulfatase [Actinomycetota bacterium]|nr:sulfatase [Actinomycetota bacterium]
MKFSTALRRPRPYVLATIFAAGALLAGCTSSGPAPFASFGHPSAPGTASHKPNIVFILTDDLSVNLVKYLPHVQAMEKAGTTLSNYFVVDSLCCPSRSAIFTGKYPHDDGVFTNSGSDGGYAAYNKHGNEPDSFAVALQKAGYRTGFMGKYLNGYLPKDKPAPGWDEWDVAGNGYPEFHYKLNENGKTQKYGKDPKDYLTDVVSAKATSFIDSSASSGKPFMLELATFAPHKPSTPAPRDANKFPGLTAPRTAAYNTLPTNAPPWLRAIPPLATTDEQGLDTLYRKRAQSVQAVDAMIGHVESELQAKGLANNTYLVFSSDNGFHLGEYRLRPGKQTAFDTDIKVPLVITGPGIPAGRQLSQLTSSIDLAPTFEGIAGATVGTKVDGTSLLPLWRGSPPADWQKAVLVEHHGGTMTPSDPDFQPKLGGDPPSYEAIRTAGALYVQYVDGEREYYDLTHDPDELHNIVASIPPAQLASAQKALTALQNCHNSVACQSAARLK